MDQPVPAFYLQLEKIVQNIAMSMKSQRRHPFLSHSELRYNINHAYYTILYYRFMGDLVLNIFAIGKQYLLQIIRYRLVVIILI